MCVTSTLGDDPACRISYLWSRQRVVDFPPVNSQLGRHSAVMFRPLCGRRAAEHGQWVPCLCGCEQSGIGSGISVDGLGK